MLLVNGVRSASYTNHRSIDSFDQLMVDGPQTTHTTHNTQHHNVKYHDDNDERNFSESPVSAMLYHRSSVFEHT